MYPHSSCCESCPEVEAYIRKEKKLEIHFTAIQYNTINIIHPLDEDTTLDAEE